MNQLQTTLLSPLDHGSMEDWSRHVLVDLEQLLDGQCSLSCIGYSGAMNFAMHNVEPAFFRQVQDYVATVEAGGLRFENAEFDRIMAERRRRKLDVFSVSTISRAMHTNLERLPWYTDVLRPFGWHNEQQVMFEIPGGEATFAVNPGKPDSKTLAEEDCLAMLALLVPAFRAGVEAAVRAQQRRLWLGALLDRLDVAVLVLDHNGHEEFRSTPLSTQLERDTERDTILQQMLAAAREVLEMLRPGDASRWAARTGRRCFATSHHQYEACATPWPSGLKSAHAAVAVQLHWISDPLPSVAELMRCIGVTQRQAEVMRLLALGLSNDQIARQLGISRHTVRHHCEWVFLKLAVHSRKALALEIARRVRQT